MFFFCFFVFVLCCMLVVSFLLVSCGVLVFLLFDLSNQDVIVGLKVVLEKGVNIVVVNLGWFNGFFGNDKVKIQLFGVLEQVMLLLCMIGMGGQVDGLVVDMNYVVEVVVLMVKLLLVNVVKLMLVSDVKNILVGGDIFVIDFFCQKILGELVVKFLFIVKQIIDKNGFLGCYNVVMGQVVKFGLVSVEQSIVEGYVIQCVLDGLFLMIGEEEKVICKDLVGIGSVILGKVFGVMC